MSAHDGDIAQALSGSFPPTEFDCWENFKELVSREFLPNERAQGTPPLVRPRYLFRGLGDEAWHLEPAFDRTFRSLPVCDRPARHDLLLGNFRRECLHFPDYREDIGDDMRCLALAQHFGLPTRLLDWTESPYIGKRPEFPSGMTAGLRTTMSSWVMSGR